MEGLITYQMTCVLLYIVNMGANIPFYQLQFKFIIPLLNLINATHLFLCSKWFSRSSTYIVIHECLVYLCEN